MTYSLGGWDRKEALIVLLFVTYSLGGWDRKEALKVSITPPTIELHGMENFKWADGLDFCQSLEVSLHLQSAPTNRVFEYDSCHERFTASVRGERSTSRPG